MAKWLIKVVGKLPEMFEVDASDKDEAENDALNLVCGCFEIVVDLIPEPTKLFIVQKEEKQCRQQSEMTTST